MARLLPAFFGQRSDGCVLVAQPQDARERNSILLKQAGAGHVLEAF